MTTQASWGPGLLLSYLLFFPQTLEESPAHNNYWVNIEHWTHTWFLLKKIFIFLAVVGLSCAMQNFWFLSWWGFLLVACGILFTNQALNEPRTNAFGLQSLSHNPPGKFPLCILFIYLLTDTGCFYILTIINNASITIRVQISLEGRDFISLRCIPKSEIIG